jgi:hypothetical protein
VTKGNLGGGKICFQNVESRRREEILFCGCCQASLNENYIVSYLKRCFLLYVMAQQHFDIKKYHYSQAVNTKRLQTAKKLTTF